LAQNESAQESRINGRRFPRARIAPTMVQAFYGLSLSSFFFLSSFFLSSGAGLPGLSAGFAAGAGGFAGRVDSGLAGGGVGACRAGGGVCAGAGRAGAAGFAGGVLSAGGFAAGGRFSAGGVRTVAGADRSGGGAGRVVSGCPGAGRAGG
jgi:hypothetical protein